jgi:diacylglycerol O-acyltransferase / wax synthase
LSALPAPVARSLWGSMLLGNDVCVTNIPGPPFPVSLGGARVEGIYAASPPSGAAFNVSLISLADRACVTITADVAAVPDSPKLAGCIEDGFAEVCSARRPAAGSP